MFHDAACATPLQDYFQAVAGSKRAPVPHHLAIGHAATPLHSRATG